MGLGGRGGHAWDCILKKVWPGGCVPAGPGVGWAGCGLGRVRAVWSPCGLGPPGCGLGRVWSGPGVGWALWGVGLFPSRLCVFGWCDLMWNGQDDDGKCLVLVN